MCWHSDVRSLPITHGGIEQRGRNARLLNPPKAELSMYSILYNNTVLPGMPMEPLVSGMGTRAINEVLKGIRRKPRRKKSAQRAERFAFAMCPHSSLIDKIQPRTRKQISGAWLHNARLHMAPQFPRNAHTMAM